MEGAALKVPPGENHIEIRAGDDPPSVEEKESEDFVHVSYADRPWDQIQGDTIVLNKPIGYVSGQEEHQHVPAVRLLTQNNMHLDDFDSKTRQAFESDGSVLHSTFSLGGSKTGTHGLWGPKSKAVLIETSFEEEK